MIRIHVTDIPKFLSCRRQFYFAQIERLSLKEDYYSDYESVENVHNAFHYGTAYHECLARWYAEEEYHSVLNEMLSGEDLEMAKYSLSLYEQVYADDKKWVIHSIEQPLFYTPWPEFDIEIVGKFDLLKVSDRRGYFDIVDHKTFSVLPTETDLAINPQFTAYVWLASKLGYRCDTVIYNGIKKYMPSNPLVLKNGELSRAKKYLDSTTFDLYEKFIDALGLSREDYSEELEYLKNKPNRPFYRTALNRSKHQIEDFEKCLYEMFKSIHTSDKNPHAFYPNFGYQCRSCEFLPLCDWNNKTGRFDTAKNHFYEQKQEDER